MPVARPEPTAGPEIVKTLGRGLEVLRLFATLGPQLSQNDIAVGSGLPLPTVHRLVKTLCAYRFLDPVPGGRSYRLGSEMLRLASPLRQRSGSLLDLHERLTLLSEVTDETTHLATLVGSEVVYLDGVAGRRILTPQVTIGLHVQAHCTALGKCLLAQLDDAEVIGRLGRGPYRRATEHTVLNWRELKRHLDAIRHDGIARSDEEYEPGLSALAVALSPELGRPLQAINIALPTARATATFRAEITKRLREAAGRD